MRKTLLTLAVALVTIAGFAQTNLAQNRTTIATTGNASAAVDNNTETRWESEFLDNQSWQVDLGSAQEFNTIQIEWEAAYTKKYEILAGNNVDGNGWLTDGTVIASGENSGLSQHSVQNIGLKKTVKARYIRYNAINRATEWGNSFWEFRVFNNTGESSSDPVYAASKMKRSEKRGLCENNPRYTASWTEQLKPGVSWTYNWGIAPSPDNLRTADADGISFAPMCWSNTFNESELRSYLKNHPETKMLLGFNEPNFTGGDGGSNIVPSVAARDWPKVEKIAEDFNLILVSPAMNFGYQPLTDGKVWGLDEWLGAFIEEYNKLYGKDPRMDYIALHTYMNWAGAVSWYVNEYLFASDKDKRLRDYFSRNGKKKIMLTEFCAWEGDKDGFVTNEDNQIDQMVQKVQVLEQSDNVAGYAWFMGVGGSFNNGSPYWHIFTGSDSNLQFTELGRIYTHMSSFDKTCWFKPGDQIAAKDYIDMSECKLRHNTDSKSTIPIELSEFQQFENWEGNTITPYVDYQIQVGSDDNYTLELRLSNDGGTAIDIAIDGNTVAHGDFASTGNQWKTEKVTVPIKKGKHTMRLSNVKQTKNKMNWIRIASNGTDPVDAITTISTDKEKGAVVSVRLCDLAGRAVNDSYHGLVVRTETFADGSTRSVKIMK